MKRFLAPIVLFALLFPSFAFGEGVKYEDLVERDGLYYKKFTEVPFTGMVTGDRQGSIKDGKWDGPYVSYYDNGQLDWKGTIRGMVCHSNAPV